MSAVFCIPNEAHFNATSDQFPDGCFAEESMPVELAFYFQPIVDCGFGLKGVEVLARGLVEGLPRFVPNEFIPTVEQDSRAERWLLTRLVSQLSTFPLGDAELFINASPGILEELPKVLKVLEISNPIVVELTERLRDPSRVEDIQREIMEFRKNLGGREGVSLALDDIRAADVEIIDALVPLGLKYIKTDPSTFPLWRKPAYGGHHKIPLNFNDLLRALDRHPGLALVMEGFEGITMGTLLEGMPAVVGQILGEDKLGVLDRIFVQGFAIGRPMDLLTFESGVTQTEGGPIFPPFIGTADLVDAIMAAKPPELD